MPHPFDPNDFPIDEEHEFHPTKTFFLKGCIHFKTDAHIYDLTGKVRRSFNNFSHSFLDNVKKKAQQAEEDGTPPKLSIKSSGNMMRTLKTMVDGKSDEKVCDLDITFVSFDSSMVRLPPGSKHSRHNIELAPVDDSKTRQEAFVKNSIPYFWDMNNGPVGVLYKTHNQKRIEIAKVAAYGFAKDAVLVLDGDELDDVIALATCVILINGKDSMDH